MSYCSQQDCWCVLSFIFCIYRECRSIFQWQESSKGTSKATWVKFFLMSHFISYNIKNLQIICLRPSSHQYLTNVLTDWQWDSRPNHTSYGKVYFTEFVQNSICLNMGMIFLTSDLMKAIRGQKHLSETKKGMKELI